MVHHTLLQCAQSLLHFPLERRHFLAFFQAGVHLVEDALIIIKRAIRAGVHGVLTLRVHFLDHADPRHFEEVEVVLACVVAGAPFGRFELIIDVAHRRETVLQPVDQLILVVCLRVVELGASAVQDGVSGTEHGHLNFVLLRGEFNDGLSGHHCPFPF